MKTLKLLTITAIATTLTMGTLHAEDKHPDTRISSEKHQDVTKRPKVEDKRDRNSERGKSVERERPKKEFKEPRVNPGKEQVGKRPHGGKHAVKLLKIGDRGLEVKALQRALKKERLYRGRIDGIFGKGVKRAVKKFQRRHRLHADGIAGAKTLKALRIR